MEQKKTDFLASFRRKSMLHGVSSFSLIIIRLFSLMMRWTFNTHGEIKIMDRGYDNVLLDQRYYIPHGLVIYKSGGTVDYHNSHFKSHEFDPESM